MAFHINDIQCSQSRPKRYSNNTNANTNTNDNSRSGISSNNNHNSNKNNNNSNNNGATEQNNQKNRENEKFNINGPGAANTNDIDTNNKGAIDANFELRSEEQFEGICRGTKNEYENKNIFAYEAYETSIHKANARSGVKEREQFKCKDTNNYDKCENRTTNKNYKSALFIEVSNAKRFSEENRIELFTAKERNNRDSESKSIRSDIGFEYEYESKPEPKRYHKTEHNKPNQFGLLGKPKAIDINLDGRDRIDKCRCEDVAFTCGNEWSNAAYCYS